MAKFLQRMAMAAIVAAGAAMLAATTAEARPERPGTRARTARRSAFQLFAGSNIGEFKVNRVYCGLNDAGEICTDVTGSPVLGGGSWPRGTPDQYVFNTGIQIAGRIPSSAGFAWAGDTVGAWAIDTRGPAVHMQGVSPLFSSLIADDVDNWPSAGYVQDTTLFASVLIGRKTASQQDTWVRYWDANPAQVTGRRHPMGILVDQRSLAWNYPTGNEDVVYIIFRFTNITARTRAVYDGLSRFGYSTTDIDDIASLGAQFQAQNEAAYNIQIPDDGYTIGNVFVASTHDMDVGDAGRNLGTGNLIFSLAVTWQSNWQNSSWLFPANIFAAPFAAAPGFVGVKYLKSPVNPATGREFGVTIFTTYTNPSAANSLFPDPVNIFQGYRYMSGQVSAAFGDQSCQFPASRHLCFLGQAPSDQRTMESSGPFTLAPGQSEVVVVAYVFAPVASTNPGQSSYSLTPYIGNDNLTPDLCPGGTAHACTPPAGDRLYQGLDSIRLIDRAMGWIFPTSGADMGAADRNTDQIIEQDEVRLMRGSLLDKSLVAQATFDTRFLKAFAPESPNFFLIPGDNQVTVVWAKSATDNPSDPQAGDPYFAIASDVTSPLYDANFRKYDVEGYRVWRGRSPSSLELVAQYDYLGSVIYDYTGAFFNGDYVDANGQNRCAPELGVTTSCPPFPWPVLLADGGPAYPGAVQVASQGRTKLSDGSILITTADTAVTGAASGGFPSLADTDVPFAYLDNTVRNGFRYYYAVTAFDVNSFFSGPSSLSSGQVTKSVTPRAASGQETAGGIGDPEFIGSNGQVVAAISLPTIDRTTGIFSGPMPQTDVALAFAAFVPQIVSGSGSLSLDVDSVVPGYSFTDVPATYYIRLQGAGAPISLALPVHVDAFSSDGAFSSIGAAASSINLLFEAGKASQSQATRYGGDSTYALYGSLAFTHPGTWRLTSWGRGDANGDPSRSALNGPRWWTGASNENTSNPNSGLCAPAAGSCGNPGGPVPNLNLTAGQLSGVSRLFHVQSYGSVANVPMRNLEGVTAGVTRAADFRVVWGASGAIDSVIDVTHGVLVPFRTKIRASWGILNDSSFIIPATTGSRDGNNNRLTWSDIFCVDPIPAFIGRCSGSVATRAILQNHARLSPIADTTSAYDSTGTLAATGNGFIFYLNGHFFLMQMAALPSAGTVWNARFYSGRVRTSTATGGTYSFRSSHRPPAVPGLRLQIAYEGSSFDPSVTTDAMMARIHTVPDPYYVTNSAEIAVNTKVLRFVNMPSQAIVRIYTTSGILVNVLTINDAQAGGELTWNLRNRNNQYVASGVYFYHIETPDGRTKVGRFTVVNYAQ